MIINAKEKDVERDGGEFILRFSSKKLRELMEQADKMPLSKVAVGKTFKVGEFEFIVLEQLSVRTLCILKNTLPSRMKFDCNTNNWGESSIRKYLNSEFLKNLEAVVGADNILPNCVDLTTDDGLKDYGSTTDKISLLTADDYRDYREALGEPLDSWWWTLTAWSVSENTSCVRAVDIRGLLRYYGCCTCDGGVRPFCIFNSDILVSC